MPKLLAVVHVESESQAIRNAILAKDCGAHGIFLINHAVDHDYLCMTYQTIRELMPSYWIGMNSLGNNDFDTYPKKLDGVWVDNLEINEVTRQISRIGKAFYERLWDADTGKPLLFGGVAFKYQRKVNDVKMAADLGRNSCDIVTTSGDGTGYAPDLQKIKLMKEGVGNEPLAVASGMTPENVRAFIPYVDYFIVATGISSSFTELDGVKIKQFLDKIDSFKPFSEESKRSKEDWELEKFIKRECI